MTQIRFPAFMMTIVLLLQFVAANVGAHQLHEGDHQTENDSHLHVLLDVKDWKPNAHQCLNEVESWKLVLASNDAFDTHGTDITSDTTNTFDLCLDCQCHGMYVTLRSLGNSDSVFFGTLDKPIPANVYFPPESSPSYRPPIV